jgi:hypothetical protein
MTIKYRGETFEDYNTPKATPNHPTKSHAVLAREKGKVKLIRFGEQGATGSPYRKGESKADTQRRRDWLNRHEENIKKGKLFPAWWAKKVKW